MSLPTCGLRRAWLYLYRRPETHPPNPSWPMSERIPPEDDPIIRSLRDAGIRPLPPRGTGHGPTIPRAALLLIAVGIALVLFLPFAAGRIADWLWYREIGFERVFFTKIVAQWGLGIPTALVAFVVLFINARIALRGAVTPVRPVMSQVRTGAEFQQAAQALLARGVSWIALPAAALLASFVALGAAAQWRTVLQAAYATPFGVTDPVFGRDVGYYVFALPAIELVSGLIFGLLMLTLLLIVPIYLFRGEIDRTPRGLRVGPQAQAQLGILAGLLLVVTAARIQFVRIPGLLFGDHLPL